MLRTLVNLFKLFLFLGKSVKIEDHKLSLVFFGSSITFTSDGDVLIKAQRNLVTNYSYYFANCPQSFIEQTMFPGDNLIDMAAYKSRKLEIERKEQCLEQ